MNKVELLINWQSLTLLLTALINFYVAALLWTKRERPGVLFIALLMLSTSLWALLTGINALIPVKMIKLKKFFVQLLQFGFASAPSLFFLFAYQLSKLKLPPKFVIASLILIPASYIATGFLFSELIWTAEKPVAESTTYLTYSFGPVFFVYLGYVFLLYLSGTFLLIKKFFLLTNTFRWQLLLLIIGFGFPVLTGILFVSGLDSIPKMDFSSLGFSITALILTVLLFKYNFFDLTLIGREILLEIIPDFFVITDSNFRINDFNLDQYKIFNWKRENSMMKNIGQLIPELVDLLQKIPKKGELHQEIMIKTDREYYFDLQVSAFREKIPLGYLFFFHNITLSKLQELEQEKLIRELQTASNRISNLQKLLPLCSWCKKIKTENNQWVSMEKFFQLTQNKEVSHIICPECAQKISEKM